MRHLALILTCLLLASTAQAATKFKTKYSSIERVPGEYTNTIKDGEMKAVIDLSEQEMCITRTDKRSFCWTISSGKKGFETPTGSYRPTRIYERYFSKTYDDAPMHYAVFFHGGYAIHQSVGGPGGVAASHGCIRLTPLQAYRFYNMVRAYGPKRTKIVVQQ